MSVAACLQVSQNACVMRCKHTYASMGIRGPLFNCMADSRCLSHTNAHTPQPAQRPFLKSLPPSDEPSGMHVICPRRRLNSSPSALVSSGGGTLPGRW